MAANVRTEMRIPTRTAPRSPVGRIAHRASVWGSTNDIFTAGLMPQPAPKKKPPPRPPPPKFNHTNSQFRRDQKPKKPARPTELLTNLFGRKSAKTEHSGFANRSVVHLQSTTTAQSGNINGVISLIDLSPPRSPTFTTRSSSDGVSIDSFGSDGNSNPSAFTSSGNTSQAESTFEDDFDFFGIPSKKNIYNDPWQMKPDPFGPQEHQKANFSHNVKHIGDSCFFAFNTDNDITNQMPFGQTTMKPAQSMPTIIRPRPPKPPAPKVLQKKMDSTNSLFNESFGSKVSSNLSRESVPFTQTISIDLTSTWDDNTKDNDSPPMPTVPPPAPPPEYLIEANEGNCDKPCGIALYDFPSTHPDDLALKEGDIVDLIKVVNDDWMEGRIGNRQGMFPTNFIDIKVPLPGADNFVTALYSFKAETTDDLSFEEGAKIKVLLRLSDDWLYGEFGGRKGQFPANFVNRIPHNLPKPF